MKTFLRTGILILAILLLSFRNTVKCQSSRFKKPKFIAVIEDKSENFILSGALYNVTDSGIIITCSTCKISETDKFQVHVSYKKIDGITIQRNTRINNWIYAGTASGAILLMVAFLNAQGKESEVYPPYPLYLTALTAIGAFPFVISGILINAFSVKSEITVDKKLEKLLLNKEALKKYCLKQ